MKEVKFVFVQRLIKNLRDIVSLNPLALCKGAHTQFRYPFTKYWRVGDYLDMSREDLFCQTTLPHYLSHSSLLTYSGLLLKKHILVAPNCLLRYG